MKLSTLLDIQVKKIIEMLSEPIWILEFGLMSSAVSEYSKRKLNFTKAGMLTLNVPVLLDVILSVFYTSDHQNT